MKALVCVKRVIDYNVKIRVKSDKTGVEKMLPEKLKLERPEEELDQRTRIKLAEDL